MFIYRLFNDKQRESEEPSEMISDKHNEIKRTVNGNGKVYREGDFLKSDANFEINGFAYQTDNKGRVISAEGKLRILSIIYYSYKSVLRSRNRNLCKHQFTLSILIIGQIRLFIETKSHGMSRAYFILQKKVRKRKEERNITNDTYNHVDRTRVQEEFKRTVGNTKIIEIP